MGLNNHVFDRHTYGVVNSKFLNPRTAFRFATLVQGYILSLRDIVYSFRIIQLINKHTFKFPLNLKIFDNHCFQLLSPNCLLIKYISFSRFFKSI